MEERQSTRKNKMSMMSFRRPSRSVSSGRRSRYKSMSTPDETNLLAPRMTMEDDYDHSNNNDMLMSTNNNNDMLVKKEKYNDNNNNSKVSNIISNKNQDQRRSQSTVDRRIKRSNNRTPSVTNSPQTPHSIPEPVPRSLSPSMAHASARTIRKHHETLSDYWTRKEQEAHRSIMNHRGLYANETSRRSPPADHQISRRDAEVAVMRMSDAAEKAHHLNGPDHDDDMVDMGHRRDNSISKRSQKIVYHRQDSPEPSARSTNSRSSRISKRSTSSHRSSSQRASGAGINNVSIGMQAAALARDADSEKSEESEDNFSPYVSDLEEEEEFSVGRGGDRGPEVYGDNNQRDQRSKISRSIDQRSADKRSRDQKSADQRSGGRNTPQSFDSLQNQRPNINLHKILDHSAWATLYSHLKVISENRELVHSVMTAKQNGCTPLHIMVWKGPPTCTLAALKILAASDELAILLAKDKDGNTPLHLFCANLEFHEQDEVEEEIDSIYINVLHKIINMEPRALLMHNEEGDTPLQLFFASPAVCMKTEHEDVPLQEKRKIALHALLQGSGSETCFLQDKSGATPLHVAIAHAIDDALITRILRVGGPTLLKVEDERGMIPLHYVAAFVHTNYTVVSKMIEMYPDSLYHKTHNRDTPLHLLVSNACQKTSQISSSTAFNGKFDRNTIKVIECLLGKNHRIASYQQDGAHFDGVDMMGGITQNAKKKCALLMANREKLTPLHCCALFDVSPQLTRLIMKHPMAKRATSMTNSFGATPLHLAAAQPGVATSVATVVSIGTHEAAAVQDRLKRTPLHVASQNIHATSILIKSLVQLFPEAATEKTQRGHLPLHLAAQSQAKEPVIRALLKSNPKAAEAKNKSSNTPLHDAAKYRASIDVVKLLLDSYPEAVFVQNQYGNLPLHCATAYQAPADVVTSLLKAWPDGASMQNRNQDAPLHYAAAYAKHVDAVDALIQAAPAAVLLLNSSGQSPIDRARANNAPANIIEFLETSAQKWSEKAAKDGWGTFGNDDGFDDNEFRKGDIFE